MRILVLHRVPFDVVRYADGIDHSAHEVTYVGTGQRLADLDPDLRCTRLQRPGSDDVASEVLAAVSGQPKPDLVIALSEYDLMHAAAVRCVLGVDGDSLNEVMPVRDKVVMKTAVTRAGLRIPRFRPLPEDLASGRTPWNGVTVLKPRRGAASEHIRLFETPAAMRHSVRSQALPAGTEAGDYEIEEYIDGPILHVDGLVVDGRPVAVQAGRYVGSCLGYAQGETLGVVQIPTDPPLVAWTMRCLAAVGITTGLFHLEAIESPDGPVFLEVGARTGGGNLIETFELATGMHLPSMYLRLMTDPGCGLPVVRQPGIGSLYGSFMYPGHHLPNGRFRIRAEEPFRSSPLVFRWVQRSADKPCGTAISYADADVPLAGVIGPASTDELERFLSELFVTVRIDPALGRGPLRDSA